MPTALLTRTLPPDALITIDLATLMGEKGDERSLDGSNRGAGKTRKAIYIGQSPEDSLVRGSCWRNGLTVREIGSEVAFQVAPNPPTG
jgi:hypothetical protein